MMDRQNDFFRFSQTVSRLLTAGLLLLLFSATASGQSTFTITFDVGDPIDGLTPGTPLSNQYLASTGVIFLPNAFSGANWATNTQMTIVNSANVGTDVQPLGTPALVSGNVLHSVPDWQTEDGDASIRMVLGPTASNCSVTFAGIGSGAASTKIIAFDHANSTLDTATAGAGISQQTLTVTATGIASIAILPGNFNDWVGVDNISCTIPDLIFADKFE
jgi:hypothetical protein